MPDGSTVSACETRYAFPGKDAACPPFTPTAYVNPVPCAVSVVPPSADVVVPSKGKERMGAVVAAAVQRRTRRGTARGAPLALGALMAAGWGRGRGWVVVAGGGGGWGARCVQVSRNSTPRRVTNRVGRRRRQGVRK